MIFPEVSKRPFGHPVPAAAVKYFCHPQAGHLFARPAWGRDCKLYVSNCHVALRFFNFSAAQGEGPMAAVDRLRKQRWTDGRHERPEKWRKLDDCTLDLFRERLFSMWTPAGKYRVDPCARVNHGFLCPLASLQAISRLPRCEIYTATERGLPLAFRFNGGDGILARLSERQEALRSDEVCHIFPAREAGY